MGSGDPSSPQRNVRVGLGFGSADLNAIPQSWVNISLPKTVEAIGLANLANHAAENLWSKHDTKNVFGDASQGWHAANVYSAIALNDRLVQPSDRDKHALMIMNALPELSTTMPFLNSFNDDALWWAHASLDAAETYSPGNQTMINLATTVYNTIRDRSQIQSSWYAKPPFWKTALPNSACNLTGGVFWQEQSAWAGVPSIATTLFVRLGARLYSITKQDGYLHSAQDADKFIKTWTLGQEGIVFDGYNWTSCVLDRAPYSYNQGVYIASQLDLHKATGDKTYLRAAEAAGLAGMKHAPWVNPEGQITEVKGINSHIDGSNFRSIWIRHLRTLYEVTDDVPLRDLIRAFVTVNFNLLLTAGDLDKGAYSQDWFGGYNEKTTEWGQCSAVDVLTAAYTVNTS